MEVASRGQAFCARRQPHSFLTRCRCISCMPPSLLLIQVQACERSAMSIDSNPAKETILLHCDFAPFLLYAACSRPVEYRPGDPISAHTPLSTTAVRVPPSLRIDQRQIYRQAYISVAHMDVLTPSMTECDAPAGRRSILEHLWLLQVYQLDERSDSSLNRAACTSAVESNE